eukprot:111597-Chlamydomonas_euryale.AAC.2
MCPLGAPREPCVRMLLSNQHPAAPVAAADAADADAVAAAAAADAAAADDDDDDNDDDDDDDLTTILQQPNHPTPQVSCGAPPSSQLHGHAPW